MGARSSFFVKGQKLLSVLSSLFFALFAILFIHAFLILSRVLFDVDLFRATFVFTVIECVMLFFQSIYYLSRPQDKDRLWFLLLLALFINFNLVAGNLPHPEIDIPVTVQFVVANAAGFMLGMYFPFYLYKACNLTYMRFHAYYGVFFFLLVPYLIFFVGVYPFVQDIPFIKRIGLIIPLIYSMTMYYSITKSILHRWRSDRSRRNVLEVFALYLATTLWLSLIIVNSFGLNKLYSVLGTNLGLMVVAIMFIRQSIEQSRKEYVQLQNMNKDLAQKVKERTQELETLYEQRKNSFINLAHETKTPLTLINNYLDHYVQKYGYNEELSIIKQNLEKMTKDVVNFFDLERFDQGIEVYDHNQVCDFSKLLSESLVLFRSLAGNKNITLTEQIEDNVLVLVSPEALHRLVNNLIENAIKYTPRDGSIHVELGSRDALIQFRIRDNGIGIPEEMIQKVFEPYYQIQRPKDNSQGMGLGLAIAQNIVKSLNGEIHLASVLGSGTEITVEIPYLEVANPENVNSVAQDIKVPFHFDIEDIEDSTQEQEAPYILIVEDNASMLGYLHLKLSEKFNVFTARNGVEALEKLKTISRLDLIVSDVMMDQMDGFTLLSEIKRNKKFSHLPFLFLTAKVTSEDKLKGLSLGAIDYIDKPFLIDQLIVKINSILSNLDRQRRALVDQAYNSIMSNSYAGTNLSEDRPAAKDSGAEAETSGFDINSKIFSLSKRETEISRLLLEGHTQARIGEQLNISEKTVKTHVQNIFGKVGVNNKIELGNRLR